MDAETAYDLGLRSNRSIGGVPSTIARVLHLLAASGAIAII
ncbi:MAG: hypothetical protein V6Z86_08115 [Hyphomicrobiales bacterium]